MAHRNGNYALANTDESQKTCDESINLSTLEQGDKDEGHQVNHFSKS